MECYHWSFLLCFFFNWNTVDLQYCVSFRCIAQLFSFMCISYMYYMFWFFNRLLQSIEYSSLRHTVGPCWLPILYIVVYISFLPLILLETKGLWDLPGGPVVKTALPLQGAQFPPLVGELRSWMLQGIAVSLPTQKKDKRIW